MRQGEHDAGLIGARIDLKRLRDDDEAGVVVVTVGNRGLQFDKPVERCAGGACDRGDVGSAALGDGLGGDGGVFALGDLHVLAERIEEAAALPERLRMRHDLTDAGERRAGAGDKRVIHAQLHAFHNIDLVLLHQVIDLGDRAVQVVVDRQHTVAAESACDGVEHALKRAEMQDARDGEQLLGSQLRVSALRALAGDRAGDRQGRGRRLHCLMDHVRESAYIRGLLGLVGARDFKQPAVEDLEVGRHVGVHVFCQTRHDLALTPGMCHGKTVFFFVGGNVGADRHSFEKGIADAVVQCVDFLSQFRKIHCFVLCFYHIFRLRLFRVCRPRAGRPAERAP